MGLCDNIKHVLSQAETSINVRFPIDNHHSTCHDLPEKENISGELNGTCRQFLNIYSLPQSGKVDLL